MLRSISQESVARQQTKKNLNKTISATVSITKRIAFDKAPDRENRSKSNQCNANGWKNVQITRNKDHIFNLHAIAVKIILYTLLLCIFRIRQ